MKKKNVTVLLVIMIVIALTIGYSAFSAKPLIGSTVATVRLEENARVTGIQYNTATNGASYSYLDYGKKTILSNISLPNASSTITFKVTVTNFGNTTAGVYDIRGLPANLTYSISGYTLNTKICNTSNQCTLGASKEFTITIKYATNGYNSSTTNYNLSILFDFRKIYNVTYTSYNMFYNLGNVGSTQAERMTYSISNNIVTVTANNNDGYGYITYRANLTAGKEYIFSCDVDSTWGSSQEAYLMLNGGYDTYYYIGSNNNYRFTPTVTGTYWLRLDVNTSGQTLRFYNIRLSEVIGSRSIAENQMFDSFPTVTRTHYEHIGWYDKNYVEHPMYYYADIYSDLKNAYGTNETGLLDHWFEYGKKEGRRISQFLTSTTYTLGEDAIIYALSEPTTKYTITFNANGGSGGPTTQTKTHDRVMYLTSSVPTRTDGYVCIGWSTDPNAHDPTYGVGGFYTSNSSVTLYAVWKYSITEDFADSSTAPGLTFSTPVTTVNSTQYKWSITDGKFRTNAASNGDDVFDNASFSISAEISFKTTHASTLIVEHEGVSDSFARTNYDVILYGSDGSTTTLLSRSDVGYSSLRSMSCALSAGVTYRLYVHIRYPTWYTGTYAYIDNLRIV